MHIKKIVFKVGSFNPKFNALLKILSKCVIISKCDATLLRYMLNCRPPGLLIPKRKNQNRNKGRVIYTGISTSSSSHIAKIMPTYVFICKYTMFDFRTFFNPA